MNGEGRGPAWSNSLFEDNAEFGFGMRLAADQLLAEAARLLRILEEDASPDLVDEILAADQRTEARIRRQRELVAELRQRLVGSGKRALAKQLLSVADHFVRRSVWIVGGDGWAYDIGAGGVDHVLASGRDVNVLSSSTRRAYARVPTGCLLRPASRLNRVSRPAGGDENRGR